MGAGHYAAALMLQRADRRINAGVLFFCAIFADILLGVLVLLGVEEIHVPPTLAIRHYFEFNFPYSHGLVATIVFAVIAAAVGRWILDWQAAAVAAATVFSHFVLDVLTHVKEIPVAGEESRMLGFGLWDHMALALTIEALLVVLAIVLMRRRSFTILMAIAGVVLIGGQATLDSAPPLWVVASSLIVTGVVMSAIAFRLDGKRRPDNPGTTGAA